MIVVTSGYFNPIHVGHLDYLEEAALIGSPHVVIINNDKQVKVKGSFPFMKQGDRAKIVEALACVDSVIISKDKDGSVCKTLEKIRNQYPNEYIVFAKDGDRNINNIPEKEICKKLSIKIISKIGGKKKRSSSELIKRSNDILSHPKGWSI
jgi:D-beta-D-heptose 7-phosphate kinase/D-beta-D-heptose 1-phosphate adenosyltransferase